MVVRDINYDQLPDVIAGSGYSKMVTVLLGQPDHSLAAAPGSPIAVDAYVNAIAVAGVDQGGGYDIVTAGSYPEDARILSGQTYDTFLQAGPPVMVGSSPSSIAVEDLNSDSLADLIAANGNGEVSVTLQQADSAFVCASWSPFKVGSDGHFSIAVGDVNGDRRLDIVTAGSKGIVALLQAAPH